MIRLVVSSRLVSVGLALVDIQINVSVCSWVTWFSRILIFPAAAWLSRNLRPNTSAIGPIIRSEIKLAISELSMFGK